MTPPLPDSSGNQASSSGMGNAAVGGNAGDITTSITNVFVSPARPERRLHTLPAPLPEKSFIGRGDERSKLKRILNAAANGKVSRTVLWGMGGIGKTTLAVFVANQLRERFPTAQLFFDLQGITKPVSPSKVLEEVIRSFRPEVGTLSSDAEALRRDYLDSLAGSASLLVLDNARDADQVRPLLPPAGCGLIVTSRFSLSALDGFQVLQIDEMTSEESVDLLRTLLPKRGAQVELNAIAKLCGNLPLALNIAGSFLRGHPEWAMGTYIEALKRERMKRLKLGNDKTKDVEAVLALSAAQLVQDDQELAARWQELSVLSADFEQRVAAAVMNMDSDLIRTQDVLSGLIEWSLVQFDENNSRYRIHDLIREVAAKAFDWSPGNSFCEMSGQRLKEAEERCATYCVGLLRLANEGLGRADHKEQRSVLKSLKPQLANLPAALGPTISTLKPGAQVDPKSMNIAQGLLEFVDASLAHIHKSEDLNEEQQSTIQSIGMAEGYLAYAELNSAIGRLDKAIDSAERALVILEVHDDRRREDVRKQIAEWRRKLA